MEDVEVISDAAFCYEKKQSHNYVVSGRKKEEKREIEEEHKDDKYQRNFLLSFWVILFASFRGTIQSNPLSLPTVFIQDGSLEVWRNFSVRFISLGLLCRPSLIAVDLRE